ncbi:MAG: PIN domain-containing protein [Chloroflexi bacterium]|nr:PIN domain-containing protein [Chloroflexota bacterium]
MSRINLFLDSGARFAGIVSPRGAARVLLLLAETGHIHITISEQVVAECERAIARKAPGALDDLRQAIRSSKAQILHGPAPGDVQANLHLISHPADVPILLSAMRAGVDFLVTLIRKHILEDPRVANQTGLRMGTPGDALLWVKLR